MTRRRWLRGLLSGLATLGGAVRHWTIALPGGAWLVRGQTRPVQSQPLPPDAIDTLVALAEVLVDSTLLSADTRRELVEHLVESARQDADEGRLYGATAGLLDHLAGDGFARLTPAERLALVARERLSVRLLTAAEVDGAISEQARDARTRVVPGLIAACWRSSAGWAAVGYQSFPGRCGDLTRYTRPEP